MNFNQLWTQGNQDGNQGGDREHDGTLHSDGGETQGTNPWMKEFVASQESDSQPDSEKEDKVKVKKEPPDEARDGHQ